MTRDEALGLLLGLPLGDPLQNVVGAIQGIAKELGLASGQME